MTVARRPIASVAQVTGLQAALDAKGALRRSQRATWTHFFSDIPAYGDWQGGALASGTLDGSYIVQRHPGVACPISSTSASSGYRFWTSSVTAKLAGGESSEIVFMTPPAINAASIIRFGFMSDVSATTTQVAQVALQANGAALTGITTAASTSSQTSAYTLAALTWYRAVIDINAAGTVATFTLYADNSTTVLWTQTLATNIPLAAPALYHGLVCYNTGTTAVAILYVDYMDIAFTNEVL